MRPRGGRLPDPGLAAVCARCDEPREAHGGARHYGACPDQHGLRAARFRLRAEDKPSTAYDLTAWRPEVERRVSQLLPGGFEARFDDRPLQTVEPPENVSPNG